MFAGLVAAALVAILGNLAGVRTWLRADDPPRDYAWFDPSRVIPDTINEFPSFSFVLGDLHAHVLALPFTVLALAFAMQVALQRAARGPAVARGRRGAGRRAGDRDAVRDQLVVVSGRGGHAGRRGDHVAARRRAAHGYPLVWLGLVLVASFVLILPFVLELRPGGARDRRSSHARRPFGKWLGDMALIYGILLWPLLAAFVSRLCEAPTPLALVGWGLARRVVARLAAGLATT